MEEGVRETLLEEERRSSGREEGLTDRVLIDAQLCFSMFEWWEALIMGEWELGEGGN